MGPNPVSSAGAARSASSLSLSFGAGGTRSQNKDQRQGSGGRLIRAPVDSDEEVDGRGSRSYRSASYRVPDTDSDDSDEEEVQSALLSQWPSSSQSHTPELDVLHWVGEELQSRYLAASQRSLCRLHRELLEVDLVMAQELDQLDLETKSKQEEMVRAEKERLQQRDRERELRLRQLSESQQQTAQQQQLQLQKVQAEAEAARRAKEEAERKAAEERRRKQEEERRKKAEQERKEQEQKRKEEEAKKAEAAAKADVEQKKAQASRQPTPSASSTPRPSSANGLCISTTAAEFEAKVAERLKVVESAADSWKKSSGSGWRALDKAVNKHVLQISATQQQVARKSREVVSLLRGCTSEEQRAFALLSLSSKLLKQCEVQVQQLPSFAFPLAAVTVNVATEVPQFMDVLLGKLHQACVLSVPKYFVYKKDVESQEDYFRRMGYKEMGEGEEQKLESTDQYIDRVKGYILFYAALTQVEHPAHPHGLDQAWTFLARMLNSLPANRITATVLDSFLKVAGYRMYQHFRGQFIKLLHFVAQHFLDELQRKNDSELSAVMSRVSTYLNLKQYLQEPDGRRMPQQDESEYNRA